MPSSFTSFGVSSKNTNKSISSLANNLAYFPMWISFRMLKMVNVSSSTFGVVPDSLPYGFGDVEICLASAMLCSAGVKNRRVACLCEIGVINRVDDASGVSPPLDAFPSTNNDRRSGVNGIVKRFFRASTFRLILVNLLRWRIKEKKTKNVKISNDFIESLSWCDGNVRKMK